MATAIKNSSHREIKKFNSLQMIDNNFYRVGENHFLPFLSSMSGKTVQLAVFGLSLPVGCSGANGLSLDAGGYLKDEKIKGGTS